MKLLAAYTPQAESPFPSYIHASITSEGKAVLTLRGHVERDKNQNPLPGTELRIEMTEEHLSEFCRIVLKNLSDD